MHKLVPLMVLGMLLGNICSCELNLDHEDTPVFAAESPFRDEKMKAASKERLEKLRARSKSKVGLRTLDAVVNPTEEQMACEKDIGDPNALECYKLKSQSDCEASKACFWDFTRSSPNPPYERKPACWPARQDECVAIDIGCCPGEKRKAVNKKSLGAINKLRMEGEEGKGGCEALLKENPAMCRNRSFYHRYDESPKCRKKVCALN